jgi:hypothetical protein
MTVQRKKSRITDRGSHWRQKKYKIGYFDSEPRNLSTECSGLLELLSGRLQHRPNLSLLACVVAILKPLSKDQPALMQWVQCLKSLLGFYKISKFEGSINTIDQFLEEDSQVPDAAMSLMCKGGLGLHRWDAKKLSRIVAITIRIYFRPQYRGLRASICKFTTVLLKWFD